MRKLNNLGTVQRFFSAGEYFIGQSALAALSRIAGHRVLIISSKTIKNVVQSKFEKILRDRSTLYVEYPGGEASIKIVEDILIDAKQHDPDVIIAVGGGSVIDAAKITLASLEKPEIDLNRRNSNFIVDQKKITLVSIPTTYGSGSDSSSSAVFFNNGVGGKCFLTGVDLIPDYVFIYPMFSLDLPKKVRIGGIADTLAHLIEGYASPRKNSYVKVLASGCLRLIFGSDIIEKIINNSLDVQEIETLLSVSSMAGIVQNICPPGIGHALAHFAANFQIPHGLACGSLLKTSVMHNSKDPKVEGVYCSLFGVQKIQDADEFLTQVQKLALQEIKTKNWEDFISNLSLDAISGDPTFRENPTEIDIGFIKRDIKN